MHKLLLVNKTSETEIFLYMYLYHLSHNLTNKYVQRLRYGMIYSKLRQHMPMNTPWHINDLICTNKIRIVFANLSSQHSQFHTHVKHEEIDIFLL